MAGASHLHWREPMKGGHLRDVAPGVPSCIVGRIIRGPGVPCMENDPSARGTALSEAAYVQVLSELGFEWNLGRAKRQRSAITTGLRERSYQPAKLAIDEACGGFERRMCRRTYARRGFSRWPTSAGATETSWRSTATRTNPS